jgi:CRP-like cAMP-binding protein
VRPPPSEAQPRARLPLTLKVARYVALTPDEASVLADLQSATRSIRRNQEFLSEGQRLGDLFVIIEGVSIRYRILRDGRRQIVNVVLPGDIAGVPGCFFEGALFSTKALTDSTVARVSAARLVGLLETHPRLAAKIFFSFTCENEIYAQRLIAIGRQTALERTAHFLLELLNRLQVVGLADERSYRLPLTQELIADALGLSTPHVNGMLRQLRDDGLISIEQQRVTINDIEALSLLADFEGTYLGPFSMHDLADDGKSAGQ